MKKGLFIRAAGEAGEATGVSAHTLRYYERIGLLDPVPCDQAGVRVYDGFALEGVALLRNLRRTRMPIARMQEFAALVRDGERRSPARIALLEQRRSHVHESIEDYQQCLDVLDHKLSVYRAGEAMTPLREEEQS